ncbi:MAG: hypothetical protein RRZ24_01060 [Clostridia bacterium]
MKRCLPAFLLFFMITMPIFGCKAISETAVLDTESRFLSSEALIEATVRELTIEGNVASVRIHLLNRSGGPVDHIDAQVEYTDINDDVLYTDQIHVVYDEPLPDGGSSSATSSCNGKKIKLIRNIHVLKLPD